MRATHFMATYSSGPRIQIDTFSARQRIEEKLERAAERIKRQMAAYEKERAELLAELAAVEGAVR